jgi:hypothetical protein
MSVSGGMKRSRRYGTGPGRAEDAPRATPHDPNRKHSTKDIQMTDILDPPADRTVDLAQYADLPRPERTAVIYLPAQPVSHRLTWRTLGRRRRRGIVLDIIALLTFGAIG